jgi:uncharacterized phage protein gp47/JayE
MATINRPEMPILREMPDQIYQRMANRMALLAEQQGDTPPATEEGEIFYDLLYPLAEEISEQQQLLEYAFLQGFLPWADDEYLDAHGMFFGLQRNDGEENEAFRSRLIERARTEEGDGRREDYERWARDINGVGGAIAIEKERNDLSIDVYITDITGQPASMELAAQVQEKLGEKRKALHDLQVLPANIFEVQIAVQVVLGKDAVLATVKDEMTRQINTYLKGRSTLVYQQIGSLFFVNGVQDFTQFTLNGGTSNVTVEGDAVSILNLVVTT